MKRHRKTMQYVILAFVLLVGGYAIGNSLFSSNDILKKGDKPPSFRLAGLDNKAHDLRDYEGKPLIINFWGTFCPPCRDEMPALQKQYDKWKGQGLELIGINLGESSLTAQSFVRNVDVNFPILLDKNKQIQNRYGVRDYPTTFFIAADGTIQDVVVGGPISEEQIEAHVQQLLMP